MGTTCSAGCHGDFQRYCLTISDDDGPQVQTLEGFLLHEDRRDADSSSTAAASLEEASSDRSTAAASLEELSTLAKPAASLEEALEQCPTFAGGNVPPPQLLSACLAIERICRGNLDDLVKGKAAEGQASVEVMIDEPGIRYCLCQSPTSDLVTGFFWIELADITIEEAVCALANKKDRQEWDANAHFDILKCSKEDDPHSSEVTVHELKAPWPFWDRDVLQRRSRLPLSQLNPAQGVAFVAQSVEDAALFPLRDERIRATVHMQGQILRPLTAKKARRGKEGIEVTVCNKLDIGGVAPAWAQSMLCRFASKQSGKWAERLRQHCLTLRKSGRIVSAPRCVPSEVLSLELSDRQLMGW